MLVIARSALQAAAISFVRFEIASLSLRDALGALAMTLTISDVMDDYVDFKIILFKRN